MKATTKTDKKDKITHIKMWIGPKILPSRLVVQKDKKSIPCKDTYGFDNVQQQSYGDDEKMSYEIDEGELNEQEKEVLKTTKEQCKKDNGEDVNFCIVDYQKTLKEECKKFAELGENVIFVYDSDWFNNEEKQKMQAFLKELPDNCYAVDGKILLEQFRQDQCTITATPSVGSFDSKFSNDGKKWHLMLTELARATEDIKINNDNNGTIGVADRVFKVCGKLENEQDIKLPDIISVFDKIVNYYKGNKNNNVTNNEIVPLYSIGNIVDFYRMIVLLKPQQIIDQANKEKKENQDNLALSNTFLYHDFDVVLSNKNVSVDADTLSQLDSKMQKDGGIILSKRAQQESYMHDGPDKIENGLMLVKYNSENKNTAIETLLANYIKFIQVCNEYFEKNNNKPIEEMIDYFNKCSIFEFLCGFNFLCYDYGWGPSYDVNFTYKVFKNFIDEQHRSWFSYSKDLSKDDKMPKGEEKNEVHTNDEALMTKTEQQVDNGNEVVNAGSNIEQFKTNVKKYIASGNNGDNNIVENIKQLAQNENGKEFLRNCHCNIAFFAKAKREHQVFLTYEKILNTSPENVNELVSINDVHSWNMCGCSCG